MLFPHSKRSFPLGGVFPNKFLVGELLYSNSLVHALDHLNVENYLCQIPKTRACEYDRSSKTITPEYRSQCSGSAVYIVNATSKKKKESVRACCSYVLEVAGIDSKFSGRSRNDSFTCGTLQLGMFCVHARDYMKPSTGWGTPA